MEGTICYLDSNMMCNIKNYIEKFSFVAEADLQMNVYMYIITQAHIHNYTVQCLWHCYVHVYISPRVY